MIRKSRTKHAFGKGNVTESQGGKKRGRGLQRFSYGANRGRIFLGKGFSEREGTGGKALELAQAKSTEGQGTTAREFTTVRTDERNGLRLKWKKSVTGL